MNVGNSVGSVVRITGMVGTGLLAGVCVAFSVGVCVGTSEGVGVTVGKGVSVGTLVTTAVTLGVRVGSGSTVSGPSYGSVPGILVTEAPLLITRSET